MSDEKSGRRELQAVVHDLIGDFQDEIVFRSIYGADLLHDDGYFSMPTIFVASPRSYTPVFMTSRQRIAGHVRAE